HPSRSDTNQLALTSWGGGRLDAFWVTDSGNLGHAWGTNNLTGGSETGDGSGPAYMKPIVPSPGLHLDAATWGPGRLDIVAGNITGDSNQFGYMNHHWYDESAGFWFNGATAHREEFSVELSGNVSWSQGGAPFAFSLLSGASGSYDLYTVGRPNDVGAA